MLSPNGVTPQLSDHQGRFSETDSKKSAVRVTNGVTVLLVAFTCHNEYDKIMLKLQI